MSQRRSMHGRYETLDLLRGVACLIVVAVHANHTNEGVDVSRGLWDSAGNFVKSLLDRGWVAVPAFFLVSAYGITHAVVSLREHQNAAKEFVARRSFRLFPPYLASIVFFSLAVVLTDVTLGLPIPNYFIRDPGVLSYEQWIGNYTLTETFRYHLFGQRSNLLADHYWTLNYELQFYVIVAVILLLARTRYFAIATIITAATVAVQFSPAWVRSGLDGFILRRHWIVFGAGILLYWHVNYANGFWRWVCNMALLATLAISVWDWEQMMSDEWSSRAAVAFTAALTVVLANIVAWDRQISKARCLAPLATCGAISYSIYLTHPLIVRGVDLLVDDWLQVSPTAKSLLVVPAVVLLSIGTGWLYFWAVERHFLGRPAISRATLRPTSAGATAASES